MNPSKEEQAERGKQDLAALKYAGFLGHTFVAVRTSGGVSSIDCECGSEVSARRLMDATSRLYQRTEKGWRRLK